MTLRRQLLSFGTLVALGGCRLAEPDGDPNALVGRWATFGLEIEGRGTVTTMRTGCDMFTFAAPMVPAEDGRFVVPATGLSRYSSSYSSPAMLRGQIAGTTLTVEVLYVRPETTWTHRAILVKDASPNFDGIACAA